MMNASTKKSRQIKQFLEINESENTISVTHLKRYYRNEIYSSMCLPLKNRKINVYVYLPSPLTPTDSPPHPFLPHGP